jgi:hypothetical protein
MYHLPRENEFRPVSIIESNGTDTMTMRYEITSSDDRPLAAIQAFDA